MKKAIILFSILALALTSMTGCEDLFNKDDEKESLYVKFVNDASSTYTITTIKIRNRGKVGNQQEPITNWSENQLKNGARLAPGEHTFFTLEIPSGEWAEYQLGVDNGSGAEIMLYDQPNYDGFTDLPITHWGGDKRTVSVTITFDDDTQTIKVNGWSDWVGIDE